jgi:hypothetical protein
MPNISRSPEEKSSIVEEEQLIKEMQKLIDAKGLNVTLTDKRSTEVKEKVSSHIGPVAACPSCIACTCMICW